MKYMINIFIWTISTHCNFIYICKKTHIKHFHVLIYKQIFLWHVLSKTYNVSIIKHQINIVKVFLDRLLNKYLSRSFFGSKFNFHYWLLIVKCNQTEGLNEK